MKQQIPPIKRRERMRAAIYARTACAAAERILSQSESLRSYAAKNGAEVVQEFADDGCSGLSLDRSGLEQMRRAAAQGAFDVLLTSGPDRPARNPELVYVITEELKGFGVKTLFVDGLETVEADGAPPLPGRRVPSPEPPLAKASGQPLLSRAEPETGR